MENLFRKIDGTLQDLQAGQKMLLRDVDSLKKSAAHMMVSIQQAHEATTELRGTFGSIQHYLTDHETRITALEKKQAS